MALLEIRNITRRFGRLEAVVAPPDTLYESGKRQLVSEILQRRQQTFFMGLVIGHFFNPFVNKVAGFELILCAFSAWYVMAHIIFLDVAGRDVLPVGEPWIK